ncbi:MAG: cupin domain-containing protein [Pseudomonadota bacterium]
MPKVEPSTAVVVKGSDYPGHFATQCAERLRLRLGHTGGLTTLGVNLTHLQPGQWSSQRHWHSHEDEFVYMLDGEVVLVEETGETLLRTGDSAAFPKGAPNGHHLVNRSSRVATYLEIGTNNPKDVVTYSDIDMMTEEGGGGFTRKDGTPIVE